MKQPGNWITIGQTIPLFNEVYDFSEAKALLGGLGIVFINDPLPPKSAYRFSALLSVVWAGKRFRSTGFELIFPNDIEYKNISYEFGPSGHTFTYEGKVKVNQIILDNIEGFENFQSTYSYEFAAKDREIKEICSFISSTTLYELRLKEGVTISFRKTSGVET